MKRIGFPKGSRRAQSIPYGRSVGFSVNSTDGEVEGLVLVEDE
ncbi:hypothetical protein SGM_6055 [Streptomyces griseoaurantiacus M045]|uniref:Uncharacterized protein n=1 Tax=Streptomyces griseoaurantiacus M045 TaxID=996637 RepID=F3NSE1_9ACTN|nr:hypothetical protein SGM_6055 [Streptomyces griseoaurantiacus M045]